MEREGGGLRMERQGEGLTVKVKSRTLDTAPFRESSPQKRTGMARVIEGSHSFTCTRTRSIRNQNEPYLPYWAFTRSDRPTDWSVRPSYVRQVCQTSRTDRSDRL